MIVLAIDTAGVDCSVAIYDAGRDHVLADLSERLGKGHAERLMGLLNEALHTAGLSLSAVGKIAVTIGPGSFTGIRTGVATARGLALALGIPAVGVTTLDILAMAHREAHPGEGVIAAIDAKRGEIYAQAFDGSGHPLSEAAALDVDAVRALALAHGLAVTGSAAPLVAGAETGGEADHFAAGLAARLAAGVSIVEKPKPLYLRSPDAKPQTGFALTRT